MNAVKVKLSPCFNWAPRHEGVLGGWRYTSTHSLTSTLDGGEWSASRPGRFTPKESAPRHPLYRRLGGPQSRSGRGGEEKNSQPPPGIEPYNTDRPTRSPALYRLSYHGSLYEPSTNLNWETHGINGPNHFIYNIHMKICYYLNIFLTCSAFRQFIFTTATYGILVSWT
jgi:hypothetical protein